MELQRTLQGYLVQSLYLNFETSNKCFFLPEMGSSVFPEQFIQPLAVFSSSALYWTEVCLPRRHILNSGTSRILLTCGAFGH